MKKVFAIAFKDLLLRFASPTEWLFFIFMPILFITLFSFAFADASNGFPVVVSDADESALSAEIVANILASPLFEAGVESAENAQAAYDDLAVTAYLAIPAGFEANALQDTATVNLQLQPNSSDAMLIQQAFATILTKASRNIAAAQVATEWATDYELINCTNCPAADAYFQASLDETKVAMQDAPALLTVTAPDKGGAYDNTAFQTIGQLLTWVFIPLLGTSSIFAFERTQGTLRRLLTTPTTKFVYIFSTMFGQWIIGIVQMMILIAFSYFVLKVAWLSAPFAVIIVLCAFAFAAVAIGTTLGTFVKNEGQATGLSIMFGMIMALLGGCWFPFEFFPPAAQTVAAIFPTRWAMQALSDITTRGHTLVDVLPESGILLIFALVFLAIGTMRLKFE